VRAGNRNFADQRDRGIAGGVDDRGEGGQSLIEFALTLPVVLLVITGIATFGVAMNNYLIMTQATSVGARQVAVSRLQTTDPCQVISSAVIAAAPTLNSAKLGFSYQLNSVPYTGTSCSSSSTSSGAAGNLVQGKPAQVTVTYPCSLVAYKYNFGACTLTAQTTEVVQ
jgi:Flp pilus assembly protein TadG